MTGGIRVVATHADFLSRRGHDVFVIYPPRREPPFRQKLRSFLNGKGWPRKWEGEPTYLDDKSFKRRMLPSWRPIADEDVPDADVVVATWWETAEWVKKLSPSKGAKAYFIQGYELYEGMPQVRLKATWAFPMHKIVVSRWLQDIARTEYGDHCVSLVPNSVDLKQFYAPARSKNPRPRVGMVYSGGGIKGCDVSIEAYELASRSLPELELVAFGHHPTRPQLPLPKGATYTQAPPQSQLRELYASCDAWLFGSRAEGFGLPILEAMACRTPVIATPAGAAPEILASGGGLLVRPEDPADMCRAILEICHLKDDAWRAMSERAYETATSYTWEHASDRLVEALALAFERYQRGELRWE